MKILGCFWSQVTCLICLLILHFFDCLVIGKHHKDPKIPPPFFCCLPLHCSSHLSCSPEEEAAWSCSIEKSSQRLHSMHQFCVEHVNMKGRGKHTWDVTQRGAIVKNSLGCRTNCDPISYRVLVSSHGSFQCW